jgi:hypothetical protein
MGGSCSRRNEKRTKFLSNDIIKERDQLKYMDAYERVMLNTILI